MSPIVYRPGSGGPTLRFRGRKRLVTRKINKRERIRLLVLLVLLIIVLAVGMYLGWWSAREEEKNPESRAVLPATQTISLCTS
jgi:flagellar basal body-associated protein FliL